MLETGKEKSDKSGKGKKDRRPKTIPSLVSDFEPLLVEQYLPNSSVSKKYVSTTTRSIPVTEVWSKINEIALYEYSSLSHVSNKWLMDVEHLEIADNLSEQYAKGKSSVNYNHDFFGRKEEVIESFDFDMKCI